MRSTSGITCCHFFCSAVFSMPVCRKPMAASALTIVSPESVTMRFSTPWVLGCCGPMLTDIVSLRSSGMRTLDGALDVFFNQFAHDVDQRSVNLLHARLVLVRHVHVNLGGAADSASVAPGQGDGLQPLRPGDLQPGHHVRRLAAGRNPERDVAGLSERFHLPREHLLVRVV